MKSSASGMSMRWVHITKKSHTYDETEERTTRQCKHCINCKGFELIQVEFDRKRFCT